MAVFNPGVAEGRDNMPSYLRGYSDSISQPKGDTSTGMYLSTLGTGVEGAAALAETTAKDIVNKDVRGAVEPIREDFTKELEAGRATQKNSVVPNAVQADSGTTTNIMDANASSNTPPVPLAIENGLGKVDAIQSAMANGKVNDTYYDLRLKNAVTDLRSKYPGFVDYIDTRVSAITGINPANAYVQNMMQDLNARVSSKKTEYDKTVDLARGAISSGEGGINPNGVPGAVEQYNRLIKDPDYAPQFMQWYGTAKANQATIERDNLMRANRKGTREEIAADDEQKFNSLAGKTLDTNFHSQLTITGSQTPQGILDFVKDADAHPEAYKSAQFETWATTMKSQKAIYETNMKAEASRLGYDGTIGSKVKDIILSNSSNYDNIISALNDKDAGRAYEAMRQTRAFQDDVKKELFAGPMGRAVAVTKAFNDAMGPTWSSMVTTAGLRANIDSGLRDFLKESTNEGRTQMDFATTGKTVTVKQQLDRADELIKKGAMTSQMKARYTNNLVNVVDDINNPNAPDDAKVNVVRYLFSPEGQGILSHIKTDYTDPQTGKFVPGKYSVFSRMTSQDIVDNVAKLAKSDPSIGKMYKNYLENEAGSQLFYKELQNLNKFTGHDNLHFAYDSDNHQIKLIDGQGKPAFSPGLLPGGITGTPMSVAQPQKFDAGYLYQVNQIVNRVNDGLTGLSRVEKGLGGDVNNYLLTFLQRSQVDLGKNWEGLPAKLVDAIAASRAPQRKIEDTFKDLKQ